MTTTPSRVHVGNKTELYSVSHIANKGDRSNNPKHLLLNRWYMEQPPATKQWLNANIIILNELNIGGWNAALEILYELGRCMNGKLDHD